MRNHIYKQLNNDGIGVDVISIDIQRGRDHGIAPYYQYMEYCQKNATKVRNWDDLLANISPKVLN